MVERYINMNSICNLNIKKSQSFLYINSLVLYDEIYNKLNLDTLFVHIFIKMYHEMIKN